MPEEAKPSPPSPPPPRAPLTWPAVLVVAAALVTFAPVLRNDFVNFDDKIAIQYKPRLTAPTAESLKHYWTQLEPHDEFYAPVTYSTWCLVAHVPESHDAATG